MNKVVLYFICIFFIACGDSKVVSSENLNQKNATISINTNIFENNQTIESKDSLVMLVFGSDNCGSCERLRHLLSTNVIIQNLLTGHYKSYYINLSYNEIHKIYVDHILQSLSTQNLKQYFNIVGTPTIVFLYDGRFLFGYPGFMSESRLIVTLKTLSHSSIYKLDSSNITNLLLERYKQEGI